MSYRRFTGRRRKPRRRMGNSVIHVPATVDGTVGVGGEVLFIIQSPSIFAAGSASSNIEAQDKDRTVNVGHHIGTINIITATRLTTSDGVIEFCVFKVERADATPAIGTHPVPSAAEIATQGLQQACRLANSGKVFHYSKIAYSIEMPRVHKITVSPAKFRLSKIKAGDHWVLLVHNRSTTAVTFDFEARYKEYE